MLLIYFLLLCEDNLMWHGLQVKLELNNANASPNDVHILQCRDKPVLVSLCKNSSFICELKRAFGSAVQPAFQRISNFFFFFAKIECGLYLLDRFDMLISKMIFKK